MLLTAAALTFHARDAWAFDLRGTAWSAVAEEFDGLDPYLLYAVALIESNQGKDGGVAPFPFAMNNGDRAFYPVSRNEAAIVLAQLLRDGRNVAIGMMQISFRDHGRRVTRTEELFDPLTNLRLGARVLDEGLRTKHPEIAVRIGRYNAWQRDDTARLYGRRVLAVCARLLTLARSTGARPRASICDTATQ